MPSEASSVSQRTETRISTLVGAIAPSATLTIDAKARALRASGVKVVSFGAGEPDFPTPDYIVAAAIEAAGQPASHHYSAVGGLQPLREAVAAKTARDSGLSVTPAQVLITNGGKQAIANAFLTLLDPGDEVIVPAPYWVTFPEAIALAGGVPVPIGTSVADGFRVTVEQLEEVLTPRTKAILFVSPSNPTGAMYSRDEVEAIGRFAVERGLWVVTDEMYEHFVYGERDAPSMPVVVPELAERCVVINAVSKAYAMTGWRVGWMIAPPDVTAAATNLQSHTTSNVSNISQAAALAAVSGSLDFTATMRAAFDVRRRRMHEMLAAIPGLSCPEPEGAFYAFPSFEGVLGRDIGGRRPQTTLELAEVLLEKAAVAIVPGEAFGAPGYARLSYALSEDQLVEGLTRLAGILGG
ncbi:MAG: aspartate aminotransferase [Gaiellaceae bacterium]|jgi:aspartate/methionine/tyrosine aminotransferase|nr:aspartate aminotransferase [Gaiellaceae bacterium]